jgi:hypothetical protein
MGSAVLTTEAATALDQLTAGLDALAAAGVDPVDARDAVTWVRELEVLGRRLRSAQLDLMDRVDRRGLHRADGHASAKVMVRHNARLSPAEAGRRYRAVRARRDLPAVAEAFAAGKIGACHLDRIARAHANARVRDELRGQDETLVRLAGRSESYVAFDATITDWVRLTDADGTCDTAERNHQNRDAQWVQDLDGGWTLKVRCGSLDGAELAEVHRHLTRAEFEADWANARDKHGQGACVEDLDRTDGQRRFDAFAANTRRGAAAPPGTPGRSRVVTNVVIDHATFERIARGLTGATVDPVHVPLDPDGRGDNDGDGSGDGPGVGFRCSTLDGHPVDPTEAVTNALLGHIRRVVIGADSVVIDLGRRRRCFTGPSQLASRLASTECYWPGCHVPVTDCQTDHLLPWADHGGGSTNPGNGGPACGRHNRHKEHGFTVRRDDAGTWHVHRPDGTEIE